MSSEDQLDMKKVTEITKKIEGVSAATIINAMRYTMRVIRSGGRGINKELEELAYSKEEYLDQNRQKVIKVMANVANIDLQMFYCILNGEVAYKGKNAIKQSTYLNKYNTPEQLKSYLVNQYKYFLPAVSDNAAFFYVQVALGNKKAFKFHEVIPYEANFEKKVNLDLINLVMSNEQARAYLPNNTIGLDIKYALIILNTIIPHFVSKLALHEFLAILGNGDVSIRVVIFVGKPRMCE